MDEVKIINQNPKNVINVYISDNSYFNKQRVVISFNSGKYAYCLTENEALELSRMILEVVKDYRCSTADQIKD